MIENNILQIDDNNELVIAFTPTQLLMIVAVVFIVLYLRRNQKSQPPVTVSL